MLKLKLGVVISLYVLLKHQRPEQNRTSNIWNTIQVELYNAVAEGSIAEGSTYTCMSETFDDKMSVYILQSFQRYAYRRILSVRFHALF